MSNKWFARLVAIVAVLVTTTPSNAQRVNVKTNALYWAVAAPNLGLEFRINRHVTFNLEGVVTRTKFNNGKYDFKGFGVEPEVRYWFSARPQAAHFVGIAAVAANYDLKFKQKRHDGDVFGGGITYGYSFVLSRHWSIETTLGVGLVYRQEKFSRSDAQRATLDKPNVETVNFAPIKAGVNFVYIIK